MINLLFNLSTDRPLKIELYKRFSYNNDGKNTNYIFCKSNGKLKQFKLYPNTKCYE